MSTATEVIEEELRILEFKLGQLKRDYEQYFLGTRPREPVLLRGEVNKTVTKLSSTPITNTAARFKFSSLCSRYQAFRRQWDDTLRKIEEGTYERHRFKAKIHGVGEGPRAKPSSRAQAEPGEDLYQSYVDAKLACGESVKGMTRQKLESVVAEQRSKLGAKFGADTKFSFRVKVEDGKTRLKATRLG